MMQTLSSIPGFFLAQFHALVQLLSYGDATMKPIISLAILGAVGVAANLFLKKYPLLLWHFIRNKLIMSITIMDDSTLDSLNYNEFMKFYAKNRPARGSRAFRLVVMGDHSVMAADNGFHWFFYNYRYYWFYVTGLESSGSEKQKSKLTIFTYGLTMNGIDTLVKSFAYAPNGKRGYYIRQQHSADWKRLVDLYPLAFDDVIMEEETMTILKAKLDWFLTNEEWYRSRNMDYKLVIMLEGPPGTGKSFLTRAIAHYIDRDLHSMPFNSSSESFVGLYTSLGLKGIALVEDLDDHGHFLIRDTTSESIIARRENAQSASIRLATFINLLQGVATSGGEVTLLTTNHLCDLDPALYRDGRVDLRLHIGPMSNKLVHRYLAKMYSPEEASRYSGLVFAPVNASVLGGAFSSHANDIQAFVDKLITVDTVELIKEIEHV